jgi:hypothetical protein
MRDNQYSGARTTVKPGQVWLIEHVSVRALFPFDRRALTSADVVIHDRVVASVLPLGGYAEPMPWSVAQLVEPHADRSARLRLASDALMSLGGAGDLPVLVIAKGAALWHRTRDSCLGTLRGLTEELADDDLLTLVFGPLVVRYPAPSHAFTANGLAG